MSPHSPGAAVRAVLAVAAEHGLPVDDPVVLNDSFNLRVHLRPAPIVARVPTVTALARPRPAEALERELNVVSFLHGAGAPVVPPSDLLPAGPHVRDGVAVSFWAYAEHDPAHVVTPDVAGRMLAELHEALRAYPGELPYLEPVLNEPARLMESLDGVLDGVLDAGELARLREAHAELAERLSKEAGTQAVHGDAHPGNLLATPAGLLWNDFEETMAAPVGWDLACLLRSRMLDGRAAVRAYGADPGELRTFLAARGLQGTVWVLVRTLRFPEEAASARAALEAWLRDPSGERRA
ncbi:Phosphotransferase enzyme family protein [Nonomuraea solani]|uniref:Phosphotransferase enzyme family protein n=1 Tax=Nonomuraea solani TaxID=1144553 RepID=A0A1H6BH49_9ACTN|nr:aminoglycoside phosphotransferase family protein [Nonomuraea solani]SEG59556.1 Phosphotransferase enzyme family protein [Nonomuraea solani]